MSNQHKLLGILILLAVIKFALVPLLEYQAEQRQQLQLLTTQWGKAQHLTESQSELEQALALTKTLRKQAEDSLGSSVSSAQYRLTTQQQLKVQLQSFNVTLNSFEWVGQSQHAEGLIEVQLARAQLHGSFVDLMRASAEVMTANPAVYVAELELLKADQYGNASFQISPQGSLTLILEFSRLTTQGPEA